MELKIGEEIIRTMLYRVQTTECNARRFAFRQVSLSSITKANVRTLHVVGFHSADKYQLRRTSTMAFLAFGD